MATASHVALNFGHRPIFGVPNLSKTNADKTSELLQQNHEQHHIYFNDRHFHNHIVHHHLTLYALGASVKELQMQYEENQRYQRSDKEADNAVLSKMRDGKSLEQYLGKAEHYRDFVAYFRAEIDEKGWKETINEQLFKGDARADDMLVRLFDGLIHPLIHLGFAVEHEQPALVAEALAQTAIHDNWMAPMMLEPEKLAAQRKATGSSPTLLSLIRRAGEDEVLGNSARDKAIFGFTLQDQVFGKVLQPFVELASEYHVSEATFQQQLDEMIQTTAIITFASQDRERAVKTDFFLIHCINCSIFMSQFAKADWLSESNKARLLEWKARIDLAVYLAVGAPKLDWEQVREYKPLHPEEGWAQIFERITKFPEDGHVAKLVRALAHGAEIKGGQQVEDLVVGEHEWLQMAHMAMDSTVSGGAPFVRNTGAVGAWNSIPLRGAKVEEQQQQQPSQAPGKTARADFA